MSREQAIEIVKEAFRHGGVDPSIWDMYAHRCNYPLAENDDEFAGGWRVIARRIVFPDRLGDGQFLKHFALDVTIDYHNQIIRWFSYDESIPSQLTTKQRLELDAVVKALELASKSKADQR